MTIIRSTNYGTTEPPQNGFGIGALGLDHVAWMDIRVPNERRVCFDLTRDEVVAMLAELNAALDAYNAAAEAAKPQPRTCLDEFNDLPIGAQFKWTSWWNWCTKLTATTFRSGTGEVYLVKSMSAAGFPAERFIVRPEPTFQEQFAELAIGEQFSYHWGNPANALEGLKVTEEKYYSRNLAALFSASEQTPTGIIIKEVSK